MSLLEERSRTVSDVTPEEQIGGLRVAYSQLKHTYEMWLIQRKVDFTQEEADEMLLRIQAAAGALKKFHGGQP